MPFPAAALTLARAPACGAYQVTRFSPQFKRTGPCVWLRRERKSVSCSCGAEPASQGRDEPRARAFVAQLVQAPLDSSCASRAALLQLREQLVDGRVVSLRVAARLRPALPGVALREHLPLRGV